MCILTFESDDLVARVDRVLVKTIPSSAGYSGPVVMLACTEGEGTREISFLSNLLPVDICVDCRWRVSPQAMAGEGDLLAHRHHRVLYLDRVNNNRERWTFELVS